MTVNDNTTAATEAPTTNSSVVDPQQARNPESSTVSHPHSYYRRTIVLGLAGSLFLFICITRNSPPTWNTNTEDDNIINGPPIAVKHGETLVSRRRTAAVKKNAPNNHKEKKPKAPVVAATEQRAPIPVVEFDDSQLPGFFLDNTPQTAAEVLACKDSVLNYVINATDTKDECDGLTKAFEKTCNTARKQVAPEQRRRRLRDKLQTSQTWQHIPFWLSCQYQTFVSRTSSAFFFFADEAVADAWEQASYLVDHQLDDDMVYTQSSIHRRILQQQNRNKNTSSFTTDEKEGEEEQLAATEAPKIPTKPISLQVPMGGVSEETLDIIHTNAEIKEHTNETQQQQQQQVVNVESNPKLPEVSRSKDTVPAKKDALPVKKVADPPYEPNSREGRICCVSILNVYQENCSPVPEDDVSDRRLLFVVFVMAMCCIVKSLIRHFKVLWLPEAAGCILVGGAFVCVCVCMVWEVGYWPRKHMHGSLPLTPLYSFLHCSRQWVYSHDISPS